MRCGRRIIKKSLKLVSGVVAAAAFALVFSFNMSVNSGAEGIASVSLEALTTATAEGELVEVQAGGTKTYVSAFNTTLCVCSTTGWDCSPCWINQ